jgi:hypothetical protein
MPGYPGPQAPASSAQINQHCILAARRTKKEHQRQNGGYVRAELRVMELRRSLVST